MNSLFDALPEAPNSPDPLDSPIASSILKGAKEYNKKNDLWNKTVAARADREQMLLKATQAVFDDTVLTKSVPRYPTDLWAGYGFSCSLPADLLKGILDLPEETNVPEGRPILGRDAKTPPRGLCAVREEDELSEFSGSFSSNSMNSANRAFERKNRSAFSASTSIFDSSPIVSEFTWDIQVFVDPAMVLAQLGCSEYMTQLREQEIDMHAFLLLDEQNLKDIGVSTIGARKKIHHAIISKLPTDFHFIMTFSASTSIFDSSPIVSEFTWDIQVFVDPAMVLAQLGCSEYMTQLREQESIIVCFQIDMHAFLLLDEQNLKDIGVSTIGARKKIHHAIISMLATGFHSIMKYHFPNKGKASRGSFYKPIE
ncbi:unnamed protein product [Strongylus vulgaris]|uniref:SAM domain-containing protein n=1 Tax=Strongylus vulgaris TaxID=40348 RepID=A0A3P7JJW8_STRVU|nr:unnamed protein product [Strongylus vulgaris]